MHLYLFFISLLLIFTESYSQGGFPQPQYFRTSFSHSLPPGFQQQRPYWTRSPQPRPYLPQQPRYRAIIRPLSLSTASNVDLSPPYGSSSPYGAPTFEDSPVTDETASPDETVTTHKSFPVGAHFTTEGDQPSGEGPQENTAENSPAGGIIAEDFDAPIPITEPISDSDSLGKDAHDSATGDESAQGSASTQIVEGSGAGALATGAEIAGGSTAEPSEQSVISAGSGTTEGSVASDKVAEETRTDIKRADQSIGQGQGEAPEHSPSKDSVRDDRISSKLDSALKDGGRVAETIDAANIRFFNRSEISTLCFQSSQNDVQNGRLQMSENAQVVAQCLMDMPPQPLICNPVDMMFVVDGSGSIGEDNFLIVKNWIRQFVNTYLDTGSAERQSQVGEIEFSDAAFVQVPLGGYPKEKLLTDIGTTPYQGGGTEIGLALNLACQEFNQDGRDRSNAKNILVLLTDGQSEDQRSIINGVTCAMSKNIDIVAIGIGNQFNQSQLAFITNHKANRLFSITNFSGLDTNLAEDLCTRINVETTTADIRCPVPLNPGSECSNSVVNEGNCAYTVTKCKLGCSNTEPRSQGTRQINTGSGNDGNVGNVGNGGYGGYRGNGGNGGYGGFSGYGGNGGNGGYGVNGGYGG